MLLQSYSQGMIPGVPVPDLTDIDLGSACSEGSPLLRCGSETPLNELSPRAQSTPTQVITPDQLEELLLHPERFSYSEISIADVRFDYEHRGGRILGSRHIRSYSNLVDLYERYRGRNPIIIFHCEFSHDRGPTVMQKFREYDRKHNTYPEITYPNVYLLEGGFSRFWREKPHLCLGQYVEMRESSHVSNGDLRKAASFFDSQFKNPMRDSHCLVRRRSTGSQPLLSPIYSPIIRSSTIFNFNSSQDLF